MITTLLQVLNLGGLIIGILTCTILMFINKTNNLGNKLLTISLLCLGMVLLSTFLMETNIDMYTSIYRFPSPFSYLILPTAYLYTRTIINKESKLDKKDWFHFLPALLHLIEMIPFYLTPYELRKELARQVILRPDKLIELNEGLLPPYSHTIIRSMLGIIYVILIINAINKGSKISDGTMLPGREITLKWIKALAVSIAIIGLPMLLILLTSDTFFHDKIRFLLIIITASFVFINLYLFLQPEILYGIPVRQSILPGSQRDLETLLEQDKETAKMYDFETEEVSESGLKVHPTESAILEAYKPVLDAYMSSAKPFLKQKYTIVNLAKETGIPAHQLSALLNRIYSMRFNEFLNGLRINYIVDNFCSGEWDQLTLEGIAKHAGFTSRTTFFYTIKKTTGETPSQFIKRIKMGAKKTETIL